MRKLVICAMLLGGCGPATEDEGDVSWVLGTFSDKQDIDATYLGGSIRVVFNSDRTGEYIAESCGIEGATALFVWHLKAGIVTATPPEGDEAFPLRRGDIEAPLFFDLRRVEDCNEDEAERVNIAVSFDLNEPEERSEWTFYKSDPCISAPINNNPPDPCTGNNNECGVPDICELTWCDDTPPLPCEP